MSLLQKDLSRNTHQYFIITNYSDNKRVYLDHNDIEQVYSIKDLYNKIELEIIILTKFIKNKIYTNSFLNQILSILCKEAEYIINNIKFIDFNEDVINKCYIILKYSSIIINNYETFNKNILL